MLEVDRDLAHRVFNLLDAGKTPYWIEEQGITSVRTAQRLKACMERFATGASDKEISSVTEWKETRVAQIRVWWHEYVSIEPELGPHRRELFYFGLHLRDRLRLETPEVAKETPIGEKTGALWEGKPDYVDVRRPWDAEEESVEKEWGYISYDARQHPLFPCFREHLRGHLCWPLLDAVEEAVVNYCTASRNVYDLMLYEVGPRLPNLMALHAWNIAKALLMDAFLQMTEAQGYQLLTVPFLREDGFSPLCKPVPFIDGLGRKRWRLRLVDCYDAGDEATLEDLKPIADVVHEMDAGIAQWESSQRLGETHRVAQESIERFQKALWPDDQLRNLILEGLCNLCPSLLRKAAIFAPK